MAALNWKYAKNAFLSATDRRAGGMLSALSEHADAKPTA